MRRQEEAGGIPARPRHGAEGGATPLVHGMMVLKYPANPPSIGDPATIQMRTALFFELIAIGLAGIGRSVALSLAGQWGLWNANLAGAALFVVIVGLAVGLMPAVNEVPDGFSASASARWRSGS